MLFIHYLYFSLAFFFFFIYRKCNNNNVSLNKMIDRTFPTSLWYYFCSVALCSHSHSKIALVQNPIHITRYGHAVFWISLWTDGFVRMQSNLCVYYGSYHTPFIVSNHGIITACESFKLGHLKCNIKSIWQSVCP